jgi:hypothetical protein
MKQIVASGLIVCFTSLMTAPPLYTADRSTRATLLQVNVSDAVIVELPSNAKNKLLDVNEFDMRKRETVTIDIVDHNPLLFEYATEVTQTETDQHKIAAEFAKVLDSLMAGFRKGGGSDGAILVEGLNFGMLRGRLQALSLKMNAIGGEIAKSLDGPTSIEKMKTTVRDWDVSGLTSGLADDLQKVAVIAGKCLSGSQLTTNTDITFLCTSPLADAEKTPETLRAARQAEAEREAELQKAAKGKKATAAKPAPAPAAPPVVTPAPISNAGPPAPGGASPAPPGAPSATGTPAAPAAPASSTAVAIPGERIIDFVTLIEARRTDLQSSLSVLRGFASDVEGVGKAKTVATLNHNLKTQTVAVTVKASPKYDAFLDAGTKKRRDAIARKFSVVLQPYTPALLSLAPAFVLLFIDNPTFKAVKKGEQFVIEETDEEVTGYNLAAMLNITPRAWSEPTFGGGFQIGVSPTKGKVGFYVGAGLSVQEVFWFGGGLTWQEVSKLADGLTAGQVIASPDDLKTTTHYKPGFYLHITATLK